MRHGSYTGGIRIAIVLLTFSAGRVFGGFTDKSNAAEVVAPTSLNEQTVVSNEQSATPEKLTFDLNVNATEQSSGTKATLVKQPAVEPQASEPAVTAPLPDALLPGLLMITATFIATRTLKRRIV